MQLRSVSAILLASLTYIATSSGAHAQAASPGELVNTMKTVNGYIANDVKTLQTRCANQQKRKEILEKEIVSRQPELTSLNAMKTALTAQLKQKDDTLQGKNKALAALRASIEDLLDAIKNANTSTATRLVALKAEREAARKTAVAATKSIDSLDDVFEAWKDQGSNEFTLYRAQFKDENNKILPPEKRIPLTAEEQTALDYLKSYDSMRAGYTQTKTINEAIVVEKDKAIANLTSGTRDTVQVLQGKLAEKQGMIAGAVAAVAVAQTDFNRTQADLRSVNARIATLSSIVIPNIPTVCTFINQVSTPRV